MSDAPKKALSKTPYLLNAMYEWISDSDETPYLVVSSQDSVVPMHLLQDDPLILNISMSAVKNLMIDQDGVAFTARFSGEVFDVFVPEHAIFSLISRETGDGIVIRVDIEARLDEEVDANVDGDTESVEQDEDASAKPKSHLKFN